MIKTSSNIKTQNNIPVSTKHLTRAGFAGMLSAVGEFGLIASLETLIRRNGRHDGSVRLGIGDDAAVVSAGKNKQLVMTVDGMVEGVHFRRDSSDWESVGWKAVAMNLSDLAAMGAEPRWMLVNLVLTADMTLKEIRSLYRGMIACGKKFGAAMIGGNTARSHKEFSITITAIGEVNTNHYLTRAGAKAGDVIAVTGPLGLSSAGLRLIQSKKPAKDSFLITRHERPAPRVREIQLLTNHPIHIHACIDISDGLASDLGHVCDASNLGAELEQSMIPVHPRLKKISEQFSLDPYDMIFHGGEDYELLMTMTLKEFTKAKTILPQIYAIGTMTARKGIRLTMKNHQTKNIQQTGFRHF